MNLVRDIILRNLKFKIQVLNFPSSSYIRVVIFIEADTVFRYENLSENDKERISRLFYLQLYSGALDDKKYKENEEYKKIVKDLFSKKKELEVNSISYAL